MADSDAVRAARRRAHLRGDHSLCRHREKVGLGWPTDEQVARWHLKRAREMSVKRAKRKPPSYYVPRSQLTPDELAAARVRDVERRRGTCSRCNGPMAIGPSSAPPDQRRCYKCRREAPAVPEPRACQLCEADYVARPRGQRFCSKHCANAWNGGHRPPYTRPDMGDYAGYQRTRALAKSRVRRLRHAQTWDGISDEEILDRDGWRCQVPGCKRRPIRKDAPYPHPRSKSVDHIIPLSLGGDDTAVNKRAAHLGCNMARGNQVGFEQTALFGVIREAPLATVTAGERAALRQRKPKDLCACGAECRGQSKHCESCIAQRMSGIEDRRARKLSCKVYYYTCRYCGELKATHFPRREVCRARECQLARLTANNLVARRGMTREQADSTVMDYRAEGDHRGWQPARSCPRRCRSCGEPSTNYIWCDACLCASFNCKGKRCGNVASVDGLCDYHAAIGGWKHRAAS